MQRLVRRGWKLAVVGSSPFVLLFVLVLLYSGGDPRGGPASQSAPAVRPDPASDVPLGGGSAATESGALAGNDGEATDPAAVSDGPVRGTLVLPDDATRAEFAILSRFGLLLLRTPATAGPFELTLPEHDPADRPLYRWVEAAGCRRAEVAVPDGGGDVGSLTLKPGSFYRGWLMDDLGRPISGVIVQCNGLGRSLPSGEDGSFRISLVQECRAESMAYRDIHFMARGVFYGSVPGDAAGLGGGHRVQMTEPGSAPRLRLIRRGDGKPLTGVRVALAPDCSSVVDRGVTDTDGRWDPLWPHYPAYAFLVVHDPGGELFILLDREDVHAADRIDIEVPVRGDSNLYRFRFVDTDDRPVTDTELRLGMRAGRQSAACDVRTDAEGRAEFHLWFPNGETVRLSRCAQIERLPDRRVRWQSRNQLMGSPRLSPPRECRIRLKIAR